MDSLPITAPEDSPGATASSIKSDDSSPRHDSGRGSPPPNCAICLGTCRNKSFTDSCLHQFCFKCLLTWSKVKAECPLCKQNFRSIIHNVRSNHQYEEYMVEQRHTEELSDRIDIDNFTATRRFRYRTTLTLPRQNSLAIQQLLLHHPMVAELFPGPPPPRRRSPAAFRRTVYRYHLWARPLPDFTRRFRDCSPNFYRHNPSQMHRLVPWLNRELQYLLNENVAHIAYVVTRILELLPQYSINSTEFRETVRRYFGDNTDHFLHELYCFASTPYDMPGYDRHVQYTTDHTVSTIVSDVLSSTESEASVDSDIVMISSSAPADAPAGPSRPARVPRPARAAAPVYPHSYITENDGVIPIETISQSDTDDDSSEVMVVGYIKPPQDRTPEVVDLLGSDSDVIVQDGASAEPEQEGEGRPASLVKLTLARHEAREPSSDSESAHTPTATPPRRQRRRRSDDSASVRRATPSPLGSVSTSDSEYLSALSESDEGARQKAKCSTLRRKPERSRRRPKRRTRKYRKSKTESTASPTTDKQKHKSHSGKGVKSSKKSVASDQHAEQGCNMNAESLQPTDQAGPSGISRGAAEQSRSTSQISHGINKILSPSSYTSRSTSELPRSSGWVSYSTSEMPRGTSEPHRDPTVTASCSSDMSCGSSGTTRGTTAVLREPGEGSHSASGPSRATCNAPTGTKRKSGRTTRSHDSKRLKSVVNVVNNKINSELASVGSDNEDSEYLPDESEHSSTDDDLPLNLSLSKGR